MSDSNPSDPKVIAEREFAEPLSKEEKEEAKVAKELTDAKTGLPIMEIKVSSPFNSYFNGPAFSISGINATGPFDILPKHHNFISLLQPCTLVIRTASGSEKKINISGGLLHVKADKTIVFLDV